MAFVVGVVNWPDGIGNYLGGRFTFREVLSDFISNCTMSEVNITRHGCSDDIIYRWTDDEDISESHRVLPTLFGYLFANFFLIAICISLAIPAGIFIPSFVIGACCGRIIGETMFLLFPQGIRGLAGTQIYPGLYSLVGASAFTGALTHSFSIAVIVCEASNWPKSGLLPMLVGLMAANAVSHFLSPSIYDSIIRLKNYPHLADLPRNHQIDIHAVTVEQIMVQDCVFITTKTTYKELRDLLIATPQLKSYPLVNNSTDRIMLGSVGRKYLYYMLTTQIGPDPSLLQRRASGNTSDLYSTYRKGSAINTNSVRFTDRHIQGNTLLSTSPLHEDHVSRKKI
uniref:Chloride channel protein n=1 Tax=Panagrolaimus superbus TaxID=310955 RepID=A0A914Y763_9BILA